MNVEGSAGRQMRGQGGGGVLKLYRKNSNHTQLIPKSKAHSLFDVNQGAQGQGSSAAAAAVNLRRSGGDVLLGVEHSNKSLDG